jgi:hypothetical protein
MPIEKRIGLVNKKTGKLWAGENYGEQSQESYDKLLTAGKLNPVQQGIDRFGNYLTTSAQADPIVGPVLNFLGAGVRTITNVLPEPIKQGVGFVLDKNQEAAENIAAATGLPVSLTDPMTIADVVTGGAVTATRPAVKTAVRETLEGAATIGRNLPPPGPQLVPVGAGAAPRVQLNVSKGKANLTPQVMDLTITDPEFLAPGVREGIANTPANIKARKMLDKSLDILNKRRAKLDSDLASGRIKKGSSEYNRLNKKIREERYGEMSSFYNQLDQDPPAFKKTGEKHVDPTNIDVVAEQHHLAAKAQTEPFIEIMLEVGDPDDLVALHEYSRMLGVIMGNSKRNMLDAPGPIHRAAMAKTAKEKAGNIHSVFNAAGMEPNNAYVRNLLKDAKSADDVMRVFKKYANEYLIPQQNIAKKIVKNYLDDYSIKLTTSERNKFNKLVSELN